MTGRKPIPVHLKLLTGNPGKRAINHNEPKPDSKAPPMPSVLDPVAQEHWKYLTGELEKMGILGSSDTGIITAACDAYSRWFRATERLKEQAETSKSGYAEVIKTKSGNWIQNPHVGIANKARNDLFRYCSELGLTPTSRARITVEKPISQSIVDKLGLG